MNGRSRRVLITSAVVAAAMALQSGLLAKQEQPFDVNDVSYLWPAPTSSSDVADLISGDDLIGGAKSHLWPKVVFNTVMATAPTISVVDSAGRAVGIELSESALNDPHTWKVVGFRVDPCAPGCHEALTKVFGASPQIRLILQPVTIETNKSIKVHDVTAHLAFTFTTGAIPIPATPDRTAFALIVDDLKALRAAAASAGVKTAGPLAVHPALAAKAPGFSAKVKAFLQSRLSEDRLVAVAFMGLAPRPEPWIFFLMTRSATGQFTIRPQTALGGGTAHMLTFRGGDKVLPAPSTTNVSAASGVSTSALFRGDAMLDAPVFTTSARPLRRDIPDLIANPARANVFNTDCISCHTETTQRRLSQVQAIDQMFAFQRPQGVSPVNEAHFPTSSWNVRNFGWFQRGGSISPTISQRTGNEAAESADQINKEYLRTDGASVPSAQPGSASMPGIVANPLTLVMKIKSAGDFQKLKALVEKLQSLPPNQNPIVVALNRLGTVHYARFAFIEERLLAVITTYDGSFEDYIDAFVDAIGKVFDQLLVHIDGAPPLPVENNRAAFLDFVRKHDLKSIGPFYSAYPELKTLDILTLQKKSGGQ